MRMITEGLHDMGLCRKNAGCRALDSLPTTSHQVNISTELIIKRLMELVDIYVNYYPKRCHVVRTGPGWKQYKITNIRWEGK